jgi:hypothetical protein
VSMVDGVGEHRPLDGAAIQAQFDSLLELHPTALVAAIDTVGIFAPMPGSVDLRGHQLLPGRSAMDFIRADDWDALIEAWEQARETGTAQADVHLVTARNQQAEMHYFDACQLHGVFIGVLLGPGIEAALSQVEPFVEAPPRVARAIESGEERRS